MMGASASQVDARVVELLEVLVAELRALRNAQGSPPSPLLTRHQLAAWLQVDVRTLRRLELMEAIPASIAVGGAKRWRRADLDRWLARRSAP